MDYRCRVCARSFPEPGFCPFDRTPLEGAARGGIGQQPTLPTPPRGVPTLRVEIAEEPTLRQQHPPPPPSTPPAASSTLPGHTGATPQPMRAVSASDTAREALETIRGHAEGDPLIGQTLDERYLVQRRIGEGGMGIVYAARHTVIERPLAIKVLKRAATRDRATVERFVREAKAASRIGHPNIVDVTDFGTTPDGLTYSVMELVSGTTLRAAIRHAAPFPALRAARIGLQIARALGAAHAKRIIHRDLKPDNVFLIDRDGRPDFVKIVDFGIAKIQPVEGATLEPKLTRAGAVFGTPEYMAPEQAAGKADTDHRVDLYALGTILYEMVCGRTPHASDNALRTITMQLMDPIVPPSQVAPGLDVPPALEAAIMKALAKDRDARTQTMGDLVAALEPLVVQLEAGRVPSLIPLPPGADPALVDGAPSRQTGAPPPRRSKPTTRALHEPEFVSSGPAQLPLPEAPVAEPEPERRRGVYVAAGLLLAAAAGAGALMFVRHRGGAAAPGDARGAGSGARVALAPSEAAGGSATAGSAVAAATAPGSAAIATAAGSAAIATPAGEPTRPTAHVPDDVSVATAAPGDATATTATAPGAHPATITVEVLTSPGDAQLYANGHYRGPVSSRLAEPYGTKLRVECRAGELRGHVEVVFDGARTSYMCRATRQPRCVPGMKNPFDACTPPAP